MRILHLYKDYFPVLGGIENHIKLLAEAQAAHGHEVTVLVTSLNHRAHTEMRNGVRVIFASRWLTLSSAPLSIEFFQRVAQIETDIAHLHSPYPFGEMANYFFGRARATVLTYHSDIVRQRVMGAIYTPLLHRVLARVNGLIATSPNYVESSRVLSKWREKCVVVPLASDVSSRTRDSISNMRADTSPHPPASSPQNYKPILRRGGSELLFVGRLRYYKGVNYLLEALTLLPDTRLTIVGTGPMEREWQELAARLGVTSRVVWAGEVSDAELSAYYDACDVFVLPCSERSEAFGAVQLEAMAAGKPVVSCDVQTGVAWVNQNESTGLVVPPKNPRALADALARLLNDDALRHNLGAAGKARVETEFTVEKMVAGVMNAYQRARQAAV